MFAGASFSTVSFSTDSWAFDLTPPPPLTPQYRVRRLGLGIGLVELARPVSARA